MRLFKYPSCFYNTHCGICKVASVFKGLRNNLTPCHILGHGIIIDIY